jgi:hypothetical protein
LIVAKKIENQLDEKVGNVKNKFNEQEVGIWLASFGVF